MALVGHKLYHQGSVRLCLTVQIELHTLYSVSDIYYYHSHDQLVNQFYIDAKCTAVGGVRNTRLYNKKWCFFQGPIISLGKLDYICENRLKLKNETELCI